MKHTNDNIICVVDTRMSGRRPAYHDIIEICVLPVTIGFLPDKRILPFHMYMSPKRPENMDWEKFNRAEAFYIKQHMNITVDPWNCQELFEQWYEKLGLRDRKRIQPLAYDWARQRMFIQDWFGYAEDDSSFFYDFFDPFRYRDLATVALYFNDLAWCNGEPYPIQKQNYAYICNRLNVVQREPRSCMSRCFDILECWKKLSYMRLPTGFELDLRLPVEIDYSAYQKTEEEMEQDQLELDEIQIMP